MRKILFISILSLFPFLVNAQLELGLMAGVSNYQGDLAPESTAASFGQTHAAFGGFFRYNIHRFVSARINVFYGTISGDDAKAESAWRNERNLSFRSRVLEAGLTVEYNILGYQPYNFERTFSPYIFGGIAGFRHNPEAYYDNRWIELQPLGTEGQGMADFPAQYSRTAIAIPFGLGAKYAINDKWNIGLEFGFRKTFTDYLDDVSTQYVEYSELFAGNGELAAALGNRGGEYFDSEPISIPTGSNRGDQENDDWYFMGGLTLSYNISDNGLVGARRKSRRGRGCPTF